MSDASFHDADPGALALRAEDADDLVVVSALVQDVILPVAEISYDSRRRQLALLLNRFRWEDADHARRENRPFERVRTVLLVSDVLAVRSDGISKDDMETVLELLQIHWAPTQDGMGSLHLHFAGDGTLVLDVECLNIELRDVTRPYLATSGKAPHHSE